MEQIYEKPLLLRSSLLHHCIDWLDQQGIKLPEQCNTPTRFCLALRDGVLLCSLLVKFDSACLDGAYVISQDHIQSRPERKYLCYVNLEVFLDACVGNFGLSSDQLFEPSALYECTNLDQVLHTLSALSCCAKVQCATGVRGFPSEPLSCDDKTFYESIKMADDYQDVIQRKLIDELDLLTIASNARLSGNGTEEGIYVELFSEPNHNSSHYNSVESEQPFEVYFDNIAERKPVISELVDTEKTFLGLLKNVIDPMIKKFQPYLIETERKFLSILEDLITAHSTFYDSLTCSSSVMEILELFTTTWYDRMLIHGQYLVLLPTIQNSVKKILASNKGLGDEIEAIKKNVNFISLPDDLLVRPCQRILKYKLMIEKLQKATPTNRREEFITGIRALEVIEDVSQYLNDVRKYQEDWKNFKAATGRFLNWTENDSLQVETYGILLHEGELNILRTGIQAPQLQYVFLFSRKIVACDVFKNVAKQQSERPLLYKWDLDLNMVQLQDIKKATQFSQLKTSLMSSNWTYKWELVLNSSTASKEVIQVWAKTNAHKSIWLQKLRQAIDLLKPTEAKHSDHQIEIVCTQNPLKCDYCLTLLRGFYPQGYRCTKCETVLHKACIGLNQSCYTDRNLEQYPWYAGRMCRNVSELALKYTPSGTFLVRYKMVSEDDQEIKSYAISYKCDSMVKHMMIKHESYCHPRNKFLYFLVESNKFHFISQLIEWVCLPESGGNLLLFTPWKRIVPTAIVTWNYISAQPETMTLEKDLHVIIESKENTSRGWWLGISCQKNCRKTYLSEKFVDCPRKGYFPKNYVEEYKYSE